MGTSKISNATVITNNTKRIASLKKYVTNSKTEIPVGGEVLKPADVIAVFQESLDTRAAVTATQGQYKSAVAERVTAEVKRQVADDALKQWVLNRFGANSTEAHEFGYSARKTTALSAADRAQAVLLGAATREARGTMGKKAKLKIKGTLVAPTAPAAPAIESTSVAPVAAPVVVKPGPGPVVQASAGAAAPATAPAPGVTAPGGAA